MLVVAMNRRDLQVLAQERLADAEALLASGRFSGAYYLAGYLVECALKACIAKLTQLEDFYDKDLAKKIFVHDPARLAHAAGLSAEIEELAKDDSAFARNWAIINAWDEESRYKTYGEQEARRILFAVSDPDHGVLQCIKRYW